MKSEFYIDGKMILSYVSQPMPLQFIHSGYDEERGELVVKVVNAADSVYSTAIHVEGAKEIVKSGKIISLTAIDGKEENSYEEPKKIYPRTSDYDDFGSSRSYGYKRPHLGHDMMGQIGTPIIAVESGYVEALGWNQYGGWRIGIRSFDKKRYYYYAHLRQNFPYALDLKEGSVVTAGDVIGYMGHTGYSAKENVNNIETVHLHFGLQLIFDESQKEGNNEIWIDCYDLTRFLYKNRSLTEKNVETREWFRTFHMKDPSVTSYLQLNPDAPVLNSGN